MESNIKELIKQILYKEKKLKIKLENSLGEKISPDQELGQKIDIKNETFIFKKEKEKIKLTELKELFKKDE